MCNPLGLVVENHHRHPTGHLYNNDGDKHNQQQQQRRPNFLTVADFGHQHTHTSQQLWHEIRAAIDYELFPCDYIQDSDENCCCGKNNIVKVNWNVVYDLLHRLSLVAPLGPPLSVDNISSPLNGDITSFPFCEENDPLGRLLLVRLLSRDPPVDIVQAALAVFPEAACRNPAAFFTACRDASNPTVVVGQMMTHLAMISSCSQKKECPYPWILSKFISVEGAHAILQAFPQGVLYVPPKLSEKLGKVEIEPENRTEAAMDTVTSNAYNLLDYILMSPAITEQRDFDETLWNKFKLILVAAECGARNVDGSSGISPVRTIVNRILGRPGFLDDTKRAQHVLWLLHQLRSSDKWIFEKPNSEDDGLYPLHVALSHKCVASTQKGLAVARELIKIILEAYPLAARSGLDGGRLFPLHMAITNGWPCHDLLLLAFPESIELPDPKSGLLPCHLAASCAMQQNVTVQGIVSGNDNAVKSAPLHFGREVALELLRANPLLLRASWIRDGGTSSSMDAPCV